MLQPIATAVLFWNTTDINFFLQHHYHEVGPIFFLSIRPRRLLLVVFGMLRRAVYLTPPGSRLTLDLRSMN